MNVCVPEKTRSGFRSDLIPCIEAVSFLSLKIGELQGLRVDIWRASCETDGAEVTRQCSCSSMSTLVYNRFSAFSV